MSFMQPFSPKQGANQNLNATTTSQIADVGRGEKQLRITVKAGGGDVYIYHYNSQNTMATRAATAADFVVYAGMSSTITKVEAHDRVAYLGTAAASFSLIPGEGM
jgi:hypothetical protein